MFDKILSRQNKNIVLWLPASIVSAVLLGAVLWHIDMDGLRSMIGNIIWPFVFMAFLCLTAEGVLTAMRIRLFAAGRPYLTDALRANAWYVLLLVMLPARLGEAAAILVFERHLNQKYGAAAMSIIAQRLFDVIILGAFFLAALISLSDFLNQDALYIAGMALILSAAITLYNIEKILSMAAIFIRSKQKSKFIKKILRLTLQARMWKRHIFKARDITPALILTALKWAANLGALILLFWAVGIDLSTLTASAIAAAYNFLAVIPLQTIGGIGIGEAGLALLLGNTGIGAATAAGASLLIRLVIIVFPFIFWIMIMSAASIKERFV